MDYIKYAGTKLIKSQSEEVPLQYVCITIKALL
jgi:hypothetical protein